MGAERPADGPFGIDGDLDRDGLDSNNFHGQSKLVQQLDAFFYHDTGGLRSKRRPDSARLVRGLLDRGLVKKVMFSIDLVPVCLRGEGIDLSNYEITDRTSDYLFTFVLPLLPAPCFSSLIQHVAADLRSGGMSGNGRSGLFLRSRGWRQRPRFLNSRGERRRNRDRRAHKGPDV